MLPAWLGPSHSRQKSALTHDLLRDFSERPVYQLGEERAGAHRNKQYLTRNPMWGCILLNLGCFNLVWEGISRVAQMEPWVGGQENPHT